VEKKAIARRCRCKECSLNAFYRSERWECAIIVLYMYNIMIYNVFAHRRAVRGFYFFRLIRFRRSHQLKRIIIIKKRLGDGKNASWRRRYNCGLHDGERAISALDRFPHRLTDEDFAATSHHHRWPQIVGSNRWSADRRSIRL